MERLRIDSDFAHGAVALDASGERRWHAFAPRPMRHGPLVSCIMPTHGRINPARFAIQCFQAQAYLDRELIAVCKDEASELAGYIEALGDPRIRFLVASEAQNVGELRNFAIARCRGDYICVWDDDDLSGPDRLSRQLGLLMSGDFQASFLLREFIWAPREERLAVSEMRMCQENTMLARRGSLPPYPSVCQGGDTLLTNRLHAAGSLVFLDDPACYIYVHHGANIWDFSHFETMFGRASVDFSGEIYRRALNALAAELPVHAYEEALLAHLAPVHGAKPRPVPQPARPVRGIAGSRRGRG
jgi:glycosyltransferase involved in cell wall biosynthesis